MPTLAHTQLTAPEAAPQRWLLVLHGLLGRGSNWRTVARGLLAARPDWGAVLVDLRMHGDSQGFSPPHTVQAAAEDVAGLARSLPGPVQGILGHSLGGKVALAFAARAPGLQHAVILDANPGPRPAGEGSETTREVLTVLRALPAVLPSRQAFLARMEAAGQPPALAAWLAMNLRRADGGYTFGLDLDAMESLFRDALARNDWALVTQPPPGLRLSFILGGRSTTVQGEAAGRLRALAAEGRLALTVLPEAGHWVHVDDAAGTLKAVTEALR
jgi:esterase